jgi:predicted ATPase
MKLNLRNIFYLIAKGCHQMRLECNFAISFIASLTISAVNVDEKVSLLTPVTTVIGKNGMGKNSLRDTYRNDSICGIW